MTQSPLMTAQEAAQYLRVSMRTLRVLEARDLLPVRWVGRQRRYLRAEIDKWTAGRMTGIAG